jgi:hypothetical protein
MRGNNVRRWPSILVPILAILGVISIFAYNDGNGTLSESEEIATEAYIFGYPLVTMEMTRRVLTNVAQPEGNKAPMGQFANLRKYPDASFRDVTAPNADTLYSITWLDLSKEPYIFSIPDLNGRYYLMPMLSGWTEVFEVPGKRTTGTKAQQYAITGPEWKGNPPSGIKELKSPTNMIWIIGRTYCTGTPEDYKAAHAIQDKYSIVPLSAYGTPYTPPKGKVDPSIDVKTPVRDQVNKMEAQTYFNMLATLMKENPPSEEDAPMVAKMAKIGIVAGKKFTLTTLDARFIEVINKAPKLALEKIKAHEKKAGEVVNGWLISKNFGAYGTNYLQRASIAAAGLGANLSEDAIYPMSTSDSEGKPYSGANKYVLHFPKGQLPPVKGFWSLTMYNDQLFFIENPINRFSISERNNLKKNSDGSIDLYIQNQSPGKDKESNWLPAPNENFILMFRFYWPEESIINGSWKPPAVKQVK